MFQNTGQTNFSTDYYLSIIPVFFPQNISHTSVGSV